MHNHRCIACDCCSLSSPSGGTVEALQADPAAPPGQAHVPGPPPEEEGRQALTLMLHRGSREVQRHELLSVAAPPPQGRWFPIAHGDVLSTVERTLSSVGFSIEKARYGLSADDAKFFGVLDLN